VKVIAAVDIDLAQNGLGLPSRCLEPIEGKPVLRHLLDRIARSKELAGTVLCCRPGEAEAIRAKLGTTAARWLTLDLPDVPQRTRLRKARKWAIEGWRGGLFWTSSFDEEGRPGALAEAARAEGAESVVHLSPSAPLPDVPLLDKLIAHHVQHQQHFQLTFCSTPPGFLGEIYRTGLVKQMAQAGKTAEELLRYHPKNPQMDPTRQDCHLDPGENLRTLPARFTADHRRGMETIGFLGRRFSGLDRIPSAEEAASALRQSDLFQNPPFPRFVGIETVRDPARLPVPAPGALRFLTMEHYHKLIEELTVYDDVCISLRGFGDPLSHPHCFEMIEAAHKKGIYGIHLETPGERLDAAAAERLAASPLDLLEVPLHAHTDETYRKITGSDRYTALKETLLRFLKVRRSGADFESPLLAVSIFKILEAEPEVEPFYDFWLEAGAWPTIRQFNAYAGQIEDRAVIHTAPVWRRPCEKLRLELQVQADGNATICRQDFRSIEPIGNIGIHSVTELWQGERMRGLREAHRQKRYDPFSLCPACKEWDRI
jgi:spiro-SPASM protein